MSVVLCKQTHVKPLNIPYIISRAVSDHQQGRVLGKPTNHDRELSNIIVTYDKGVGTCSNVPPLRFSNRKESKAFCSAMLCPALARYYSLLPRSICGNCGISRTEDQIKTRETKFCASAVRLRFACVAGLEVRRREASRGFHEFHAST